MPKYLSRGISVVIGHGGTKRVFPSLRIGIRFTSIESKERVMTEGITLDELLKKYPVDPKRLRKNIRQAQAAIDGVKLAELRQAKKLTQKQMAKRLRIDQSNISRIERGGFDSVEIRTLRRYAEALGGELEIRVNIDKRSEKLIDSEYEKKLERKLARQVAAKREKKVPAKSAPEAKSVANGRKIKKSMAGKKN